MAHFAAAAACKESSAILTAHSKLAFHKAPCNPFRNSNGERGRGPTGAWDIASTAPEKELLVKKKMFLVYKKSPFLRSICLNQLSFVPSADELIKKNSLHSVWEVIVASVIHFLPFNPIIAISFF